MYFLTDWRLRIPLLRINFKFVKIIDLSVTFGWLFSSQIHTSDQKLIRVLVSGILSSIRATRANFTHLTLSPMCLPSWNKRAPLVLLHALKEKCWKRAHPRVVGLQVRSIQILLDLDLALNHRVPIFLDWQNSMIFPWLFQVFKENSRYISNNI